MVTSKKVLSVFLASPGDLIDERRHARDAAEEWNAVNSDRTGWIIDLLGWEDTLPQSGRPQEIINTEIRRSLLFIGMMNRAWGSPTGNGFTSGFHEEFELASSLQRENGRPEIALFFKELGAVADPGEQLRRVIEFREEVFASKKFFVKQLSYDLAIWKDEFRKVFHKLVFNYIDQLDVIKEDDEETGDAAEKPSIDAKGRDGDLIRGKMASLKIVSDILLEADNDYEVDPISVIRLRLIASSWRRPGMNEAYLGTHDANLMYRNGSDTELRETERFGLMESGLFHYSSQNAPLWKWVSNTDKNLSSIRILALYSSDDAIRISALKILSRCEIQFGGLEKDFKQEFPEAKTPVKNAMLQYIGEQGSDDLVQLALKEFEKSDYATVSTASSAIIAAYRRVSLEESIKFVLEKNVALSLAAAPDELAGAAANLPIRSLESGLTHRDAGMRAFALAALNRRGQLTVAKRQELLNDPSAVVRAAAVKAALDANEAISLDECEKIVVRTVKGLSGDTLQGTEELETLRADILSSESDIQLSEIAEELYQPAENAYAVLLTRHWKSRAEKARRNVRDRFKSHFDNIREEYVNKYGEILGTKLFPENTSLIYEYRASKMVRSVLDVIAVLGDSRDLESFRISLLDKYTTLKPEDLRFFEKYGEIEDLDLLSSANRISGGSLLNSKMSLPNTALAKSILRIGKGDLAAIFDRDISSEIRRSVAVHASKASVLGASDKEILNWLNDKDDELRRIFAIRVAQSCTKRRVRSLLAAHHEQSYVFYNVTHWLDLAASMPASTVARVTAQALKEVA
ncbi:MAG: DUF4062 domain-containing protein [Alphaproteobacteria bacterium]|nr:MAG: DUF4062 domain-containing protein [Alphaproteobacteria bacterium]